MDKNELKKMLQEMGTSLVEQFQHFEVIPDKQYRVRKTKCFYFGLCYQKALEYVITLHDREIDLTPVKLVHGVLGVGGFLEPSHAWVEIEDEIVFDGVLRRFYTKEGYYRERVAAKVVEFAAKDAPRLLLQFRHYGPWYSLEDQLEERRLRRTAEILPRNR